jgi:hypothetical protein
VIARNGVDTLCWPSLEIEEVPQIRKAMPITVDVALGSQIAAKQQGFGFILEFSC